MRRILLLVPLVALAMAGVAYAAIQNLYTITAEIHSSGGGTPAHPKPAMVRVGWSVDTSPAGERPATVSKYSISLAGIQTANHHFRGCGTSTLDSKGPSGCPAGAWVGGGHLIIEAGPAGTNDSVYNGRCRAEVSIFNGGDHSLSLYVYQGSQRHGAPAPCPLPGGPVTIDVSLHNFPGGLLETFTMPPDLLHIFGTDSAVVQGVLGIPRRRKIVHRRFGHRVVVHRVGLLESTGCLPDHQRYVSMTFTREDGVSDTRRILIPCG